jgi:demethylmenaquinone methyltransferase / 2-methoxy-6-polyprenyl-1,4-benzoquinol methylase
MNQETESHPQDPVRIKEMFDAIAPTYDLLNRMLSFGLDVRWRRKAVAFLEEKHGGRILDIAAGSGDVSLEVLGIRPARVVATDFAPGMLRVFRRKLATRSDGGIVDLVICDALRLPFRNESFDGTIVAFGIRNFADRDAGLREMLRVLVPGGISVILELSRPHGAVMRGLYNVYARIGIPLLGRIVSRHESAYRYLPESIRHFPERGDFLSSMAKAGFASAAAHPLTFGGATIYVGRKAEVTP